MSERKINSMTRQISRLIFVATMLLIFRLGGASAQKGITTSTENQRVGKMEGVASLDHDSQPRYVNFVGLAREENKKRDVQLAIGIGDVNSKGSLTSEGEAHWSLLTLDEAKQASKALRQMNELANHKLPQDFTNKTFSYQVVSRSFCKIVGGSFWKPIVRLSSLV